MTPKYRWAAILTMALGATHGASARRSTAGAATVAMGRYGGGLRPRAAASPAGMGVYAAGAGPYNVQTAQARSINANTAHEI